MSCYVTFTIEVVPQCLQLAVDVHVINADGAACLPTTAMPTSERVAAAATAESNQ